MAVTQNLTPFYNLFFIDAVRSDIFFMYVTQV